MLVASAKKPADHERIAAYYRVEAQQLEAKDHEHEEDLAEYLKNSSGYSSKYRKRTTRLSITHKYFYVIRPV